MKTTDQFVFFYNGPLSQWYIEPFQLCSTVYTSAEQYMMAMKAAYFGDHKIHDEIMSTISPAKQKALGRQVKPFDDKEWDRVCENFVFMGNLAKFRQNPGLARILLDTGDRELVEASPYDRIWGIGLKEDDPRALDKSQWNGTNRLGKVLMEVRETLRRGKVDIN